jgi:hypothetical protein
LPHVNRVERDISHLIRTRIVALHEMFLQNYLLDGKSYDLMDNLAFQCFWFSYVIGVGRSIIATDSLFFSLYCDRNHDSPDVLHVIGRDQGHSR